MLQVLSQISLMLSLVTVLCCAVHAIPLVSSFPPFQTVRPLPRLHPLPPIPGATLPPRPADLHAGGPRATAEGRPSSLSVSAPLPRGVAAKVTINHPSLFCLCTNPSLVSPRLPLPREVTFAIRLCACRLSMQLRCLVATSMWQARSFFHYSFLRHEDIPPPKPISGRRRPPRHASRQANSCTSFYSPPTAAASPLRPTAHPAAATLSGRMVAAVAALCAFAVAAVSPLPPGAQDHRLLYRVISGSGFLYSLATPAPLPVLQISHSILSLFEPFGDRVDKWLCHWLWH